MERITLAWIDTIPLHVPMLPLDELATRARRYAEKTGTDASLGLHTLERDYLRTTMLASPVLPNAQLRASWSNRLRTEWEARLEHAITGCYPHLTRPAMPLQPQPASHHRARPMTHAHA